MLLTIYLLDTAVCRVFTYGTCDRAGATCDTAVGHLGVQVPRQAYEEDVKMSYSISPVSQSTRMLSKPGKAKRKIPKIPFKV